MCLGPLAGVSVESKAGLGSSPALYPTTEDEAVLGVHFDLGWEWWESAGGPGAGLVDLH